MQFKYPERPLDQIDDDWPEINRNMKRVQKLWWRLGKMLRIKEEYTDVLEIDKYMVVLQLLGTTC